jgi:cell filamentation protein
MPYDSNPDPYIDFETGTLKNLLGIASEKELEEAEADITYAAIASIPEGSALGEFNLEHIQNIHWELFNAIYDWAGEIRTVEISKGSTRFANANMIERAATTLFSNLHGENLLKSLPRDQYVQRLAHYYSEVNILHPFREGNGRTQRTFFSQLATAEGYHFAWERIGTDKNIRVCIAAYDGDEAPLAKMLDELLEQEGEP